MKGLMEYLFLFKMPKIHHKCHEISPFEKKTSKIPKKYNQRSSYNPFMRWVVQEQQKGVVGGEAPCHVTCVGNGFCYDPKVKRREVAF